MKTAYVAYIFVKTRHLFRTDQPRQRDFSRNLIDKKLEINCLNSNSKNKFVISYLSKRHNEIKCS